jgi:lauroyl/myristoyl acyltransferase
MIQVPNDPPAPSGFYRAGFWRLGLWLGRVLPSGVSVALSRLVLALYARLASARREVVVKNLLPVLQDDRAAAEQSAHRLFQNFAIKLVDLWRYESGCQIDLLFDELTGWEHFLTAHTPGRGVLLITPHLGNWEFGGPLLTRRGIKLHVITLAEPGRGLTEMRQASRARQGIETLVIGQDAFAFVEVIKRLQSGAAVALLVDRPPAGSAVTVELFGRPFHASIAAAELARASGAALVPVVLPRTGQGYAAHVLPEIAYDRAALGTREARRELTQKIMRAFEPAIRQHPDQWYHFVPVWPEK